MGCGGTDSFAAAGPGRLFAAVILAMRCALSVSSEHPGCRQNADEGNQLQEIVVTGKYQFLSVDTSGATNLPVPIEQVPQSISLVNDDFLKAADLKTLGQIAEYTLGPPMSATSWALPP